MKDFFTDCYDEALREVTIKFKIRNLSNIQKPYDDNDYWPRLARGSYFEKLFKEHHYHFLYEIQGLSSQIHYGIANALLLRDKISTVHGDPNVYNHRYTFMLESSIHSIYSYWNRVGLVLNTYLKKPYDIKHTYFRNVVQQLVRDYPALEKNPTYLWIVNVNDALDDLDRNEFAHNNSLIMQNFLPKTSARDNFDALLALPEILLTNNEFIVNDISNLCDLVEKLESITKP